VAAQADCTDDRQVAALFDRIAKEHGRIDVLANAVWGAADALGESVTMDNWMSLWSTPFWEQPTTAWQHMMDGGPRAYFLMSTHAIRNMVKQGRGLIVGVTDLYFEPPPGKKPPDPIGHGQLLWTLSHLCINLLMQGIAGEAKKKKIAALTLMPGFMRTERVVRVMTDDKIKKQFRFDLSESTEFIGRAVAALAADSRVMSKSGRVHFVADLAREYGFTDVDGRQVPKFNPDAVGS
jgi:NAD(P)-dependent dehydrogenase (short-subunit alcohol dehydrogenase family)